MATLEDLKKSLESRSLLRDEINTINAEVREQNEKIETLTNKRDRLAIEFITLPDASAAFISQVESLREYVRSDHELLKDEYPEFSYSDLTRVYMSGIYAVSEVSSKYLTVHWTSGKISYRQYSDIKTLVSRNRALEENTTLLPAAWFFQKSSFRNSFAEKVSAKQDLKAAAKMKDVLEKSAKRSVRRAGGDQFELDTLGGEGKVLDVMKFLAIRSRVNDRQIGSFAYPYVAVGSLLVLAQSNDKEVTHENIEELLINPLTEKIGSLITPHEIAINRVHIDTFKEILARC